MLTALLVVLVAILLTMPSLAQEDETHPEHATAEEPPVPVEPAVQEDPVPVEQHDPPTPVPEPEPEPVPEPEPEPVPVPEPVQEKKENPLVVKSKALLEKVKSISQKDAKKIAAAVVGVWGVSAGVGWIVQNANNNNAPPTKKK